VINRNSSSKYGKCGIPQNVATFAVKKNCPSRICAGIFCSTVQKFAPEKTVPDGVLPQVGDLF
jgi:hypothetical protein